MAPPVTVHAPAACGVHPSRLVPLNMETRFGSPYGLVGGGFPAGVWTASAPLGGETLPAASTAVTVMLWSASGVSPVQVPVVVGAATEPHAVPSAEIAYPVTPTLSVA